MYIRTEMNQFANSSHLGSQASVCKFSVKVPTLQQQRWLQWSYVYAAQCHHPRTQWPRDPSGDPWRAKSKPVTWWHHLLHEAKEGAKQSANRVDNTEWLPTSTFATTSICRSQRKTVSNCCGGKENHGTGSKDVKKSCPAFAKICVAKVRWKATMKQFAEAWLWRTLCRLRKLEQRDQQLWKCHLWQGV